MTNSSLRMVRTGIVVAASALLFPLVLPGVAAHAAVTSCTGTGATFAGGAGTTASPYQVASPAQLAAISGDYLSCAFIQTADITLTGSWDPIGAVVGSGDPYLTNLPFTGSYDGNSKTISGLSISAPGGANDDDGIGLFGSLDGARINDLEIADAEVSAELRESVGILVGYARNSTIEDVRTTGAVQGIRGVGGLVGKIAKGSVVRNCTSAASVNTYFDGGGGLVGNGSPADSDNTVNLIVNSSASGDVVGARGGNLGSGGLVGFSFGSLAIEESWALGDVMQPEGPRAGGLIGLIYPAGGGTTVTVTRAFAQGDVHVEGTGASGGYSPGEAEAGGLVGVMFEGVVTDSFSVGSVTGDVKVGGLIGSAVTINPKSLGSSYSLGVVTTNPSSGSGGGVLGFSSESPSITQITATFWNPTSSGISALNDYGSEQTLAQMKLTNTYSAAGWDISEALSGSSVWVMNPASGCLPYLRAIPESRVGTADTSGATACAVPAPAPEPAPAPAASTEPAVVPTVAPVVIPTTAPVAEPVTLSAGAGGALINGVVTPVTVAAAPGGKAVVVSAGGVTVEVGGTSPDGTLLPLAADGSLVIAPTGGVQMGGSGFSPNSMVSLYLYSTPTKLGELPVSASGSYSGAALIPAGIEAGSHTIQAIGYTPDGATLALSVGVTVKSVAAIRGANPTVKASAGAKAPGARFTATATGVQARCMVTFWTKGTTVKTKAGVAGRASAMLTAPSAKGAWAVTATVSGKGCEQKIAKSMIKVT